MELTNVSLQGQGRIHLNTQGSLPSTLMKLITHLSFLTLCATTATADLTSSIEKLRSVGREGSGNTDASGAWQEVVKTEASNLPAVLEGMNGANPLAENWIRAAVDTIADRALATQKDLPISELKAFIADTGHSAAPRVLAFDLIQKVSPGEAEKITPSLLEDPSSDLRRYPIVKLIEDGEKLLEKKDTQAAGATFEKALISARDEDQIKKLTKSLRDLGKKVDLVKHFGFLTQWNLIAPFTNVERKGFNEVFPPEREINLATTYPGKTGQLKWVEYKSTDEYGVIDFNKPFGMEKQVTGYAYTEFNSTEEREAEIRLGCKNGWKIWLNGKLIFARDEYHRGMKLDQYKLPAKLQKGRNAILVKCCQNEQTEEWTVEWQFQLRVCDSTGTAISSAP